MKIIAKFIFTTACCFAAICTIAASKPQLQSMIVQSKKTTTVLHYNGVLDPIESTPVLSPVDGTITKMNFKFGSKLTKGQTLFTLDSTSLEKDYRDAISTYLKAKQQLNTDEKEYTTDKLLFKAGVFSKDELTTAQVTVENDNITLLQAKIDLQKVLSKTDIDIKQVESLKLTEADKVNKILGHRMKNITISSPSSGVALFPIQTNNQSGSDSTPIQVGSDIKTSSYMLSIGDLSGFSTTAKVSEININKVKQGQAAQVTGNAFPGITLKGVVTSVDSQAQQSNDSSNISLFKIYIDIPHISEQAKKIIHVGMTAAISISIHNPKHIIIPIGAVYSKDGKNFVSLVTTNGTQAQEVLTGSTTPTGVSILHGLKDGDKITFPKTT